MLPSENCEAPNSYRAKVINLCYPRPYDLTLAAWKAVPIVSSPRLHVAFVCSFNRARSVMAAVLFAEQLRELGLGDLVQVSTVRVGSGVSAASECATARSMSMGRTGTSGWAATAWSGRHGTTTASATAATAPSRHRHRPVAETAQFRPNSPSRRPARNLTAAGRARSPSDVYLRELWSD